MITAKIEKAKEILRETVETNVLQANDLSLVRFVDSVFPLEHWYYEGNLFIKRGLPAGRVSEIIKEHLLKPTA